MVVTAMRRERGLWVSDYVKTQRELGPALDSIEESQLRTTTMTWCVVEEPHANLRFTVVVTDRRRMSKILGNVPIYTWSDNMRESFE